MVSYVVIVGDLPSSRCRACAGWRRGAQCVLDDGDRSEGVGWDGELAEGATHFSFHESNNHNHYGSGTVLTTT